MRILALAAILAVLPMSSWAQSAFPVRIESENATLAGTLVLPEGRPLAAAILIQGAGPHGRDQVISGAPMFRELADGLAAKRIATLRIDNAGVGESTGDRVQHFLERGPHIIAALDALGHRPELADVPLGLIGHSEGSLVATTVWADRRDAVDFLVLLGAPGRPGREVWVEQQSNPDRFPQHDEGARTRIRAAFSAVADASITGDSQAVADSADALFEATGLSSDEIAEIRPDFISRMASPEMQVFLGHDPASTFALVAEPILMVWGNRDTLTSPAQNVPVFISQQNENAEVTLMVLPDEDHFFLRGQGLPPGEHRMGAMALSPVITEVIADWIGRLADLR